MERISKQLFAHELNQQVPPKWIVRQRQGKSSDLALFGENVLVWGNHLKTYHQEIFEKAFNLRKQNNYTHTKLRNIVKKHLNSST